MKILTLDNLPYELDTVPDEIDDIRYSVLDYTDPNDADYIFVPLVFLESFNAPAAVCRIGPHKINIPLDWSLVISEPDVGDAEVMSLMTLNDRNFKAFCLNPLSDIMPEFLPITIENIFSETKWFFPKLKPGHILTIPLEEKSKPTCAYFLKETNKVPEVLSIDQIWI
ncbi:MAG: hypothetical protein CXT73_02005 [Methanobacteriota archaeon]|jgi:hypothetical protein|nr:MAG: hypothetical protein CXT73_02005 [Euryarchaeota archaeon]